MKKSVKIKLLKKECQICLIEYSQNLTQLMCGHIFHSHCIEEWFGYQSNLGRNKTCPTCRSIVKTEPEQKNDVCCFSFCFGYRKKNR